MAAAKVVVRIPSAYPEGSFLADLVNEHGKALAALKDDRERDAWLLAHLRGLPRDALPRSGTIDTGKSNLATVAYSTGHRADVHTGGRFIANMEELIRRIGERVSAITPERAKELQGTKEELQKLGGKLPKAEDIELRTLLKAVYADDEYRRLMGKKRRWSEDFLHKLSTHIVRTCAERDVGVIVIGRNKLWKQEVEMGRRQNRGFCAIAHATLIRLITYKAESRGIAAGAGISPGRSRPMTRRKP